MKAQKNTNTIEEKCGKRIPVSEMEAMAISDVESENISVI